ncbi:MAG TPA: glycosyltransferase family 4 protein [Rhodanobacteraceae bacterium]|nr:glycosyltransferase family 4 protein [Rhodanobacteraceae bacterium]
MKIWLPSIRARSGADIYAERLAQGLRERGVQPVVEWLPHAYQYAPWLLRTRPPPTGTDVISANSQIAFAFCHHSVPLVATALHCVAGRGYPQWKSLPQAIFHDQLVRRFERASFRTANAVIAISDSTRREVREDFGVRDVHTIPLWIDAQVFSPGPKRISTDSDRTCVLIVGNMSRRKGGDLIAPFCDALGNDFDVTVVTGLRTERPAVSVNGAGLRFASGLTTDQLVAAYRNTDILVSLSRHEGFGYTALEGMACGKPVVAFDVSGLRDVVVSGGTGLLAPIEDVAALAACCRTLREHPAQARALGQAGLHRALTVFAEERAIEAHLELYSELLTR